MQRKGSRVAGTKISQDVAATTGLKITNSKMDSLRGEQLGPLKVTQSLTELQAFLVHIP